MVLLINIRVLFAKRHTTQISFPKIFLINSKRGRNAKTQTAYILNVLLLQIDSPREVELKKFQTEAHCIGIIFPQSAFKETRKAKLTYRISPDIELFIFLLFVYVCKMFAGNPVLGCCLRNVLRKLLLCWQGSNLFIRKILILKTDY